MRPPFHILTKPIGPICNLDCKYCFYLEKEKLYPPGRSWRMPDDVLDAYVRQYIEQQDAPEIFFAWQGGEPTLLGVDYFRNAVALQRKYADGKTVHNVLQTNGTLLDDDWCSFFADHHFLVGLSVDGPRDLHDHYRVDKKQNPTFDAVMTGLSFLKKHRVAFNTLTVVNRANSQRPLDVYRFLKQINPGGYLQFIPLVERAPFQPGTRNSELGTSPSSSFPLPILDFADPPIPGESSRPSPVTPWSVEPHAYGHFLCTIFDEWVRHDVGSTFVQHFDAALRQWMGMQPGLCVFAETCGSAMALEHNGDLYSCDHYVYPRYKLGNLLNDSLRHMADSPAQTAFGQAKLTSLPDYCLKCDVRFACNGECPKHRFATTPDGQEGLNYLCPAYKQYFTHITPYMNTLRDLLRADRHPAEIMSLLASQEPPPNRNAPCPCGSGRKFKNCCARTA